MIVIMILIFVCVWYCLGSIDTLIKNADKWEDDREEDE